MSEDRAQGGVARIAIAVALIASAVMAGVAPLGPRLLIGEARAEEDPAAPREVARTTSGGYSVHANAAEVTRLLRALGTEAGFTVNDTGKFQLPVTVAIDDAPLDMTLRRLLRDANFIIVYRGGKRGTEISADGIEQIILLSPAGQNKPQGQPPPASPLSGQHHAAAPGGAQPGVALVPPVRARNRRAQQMEEAAAAAAAAAAAQGQHQPEMVPVPGAPGVMQPNVPPEVAGMIPPPQPMPDHEAATENGSIGMAGAVGQVVDEPDDADLDEE